jgi:hypothetical protein
MNTTTPMSQRTLFITYAAVVLLPCVLITFAGQLPHFAILGTVLAYAFALWPTYYVDQSLFGGGGFHSWSVFGIFAVILAAMLWPFPVLSAAPALWQSTRWRRLILGYGAVFVVFLAAAAWQMLRRLDVFFG